MKVLTKIARTSLIVCAVMLVTVRVADAQCAPNPTHETSLSIMNASAYALTFYVDGARRGVGWPGELSMSFIITPGEHVLFAEAVVDGETLSASRRVTIAPGQACTWTVTNMRRAGRKLPGKFSDFLARQAVVSIAALN